MQTKMKKRPYNHSKSQVPREELTNKDGRYTCKVIQDKRAISNADMELARICRVYDQIKDNPAVALYSQIKDKSTGVLYCQIRDNNAGVLEKIIGLDEKKEEITYVSIEVPVRGVKVEATSHIDSIKYNSLNRQFTIEFHHNVPFEDNTYLSLPPRTKNYDVPKNVPETLALKYKPLVNYFKSLYTHLFKR